MRISVINHARPRLSDRAVQEALRAVNRQIAEDFEPHWHRGGRLRLEGATRRRPNPRSPGEMRGDAVIYLWDQVCDDAFGFHDLNYRGIPFGFVFVELSDALREDWRVTLSHEALEMLVDPETNLLVQGPHPEDVDRTVYHWYEVCDAVQTQTYEIDGLPVSNFVLPLYFTEGDETGGRNDFLGALGAESGEPLRSFGVTDGGYIGFFDPESEVHETYVGAGDALAQRRQTLKNRAGLGRRALRYQRERSPERALRLALDRSPDEALPGPWFEGLAIDVADDGGADPFDLAVAAADAVLGRGWGRRWHHLEPLHSCAEADCVEYEFVPRPATAREIDAARGWEIVYGFRDQPGVQSCDPYFGTLAPDTEAAGEARRALRASGLFGSPDLPESDAPEWSLELVRGRAAWQHARGAGVQIAHPDTGFIPHAELEPDTQGGPVRTDLDRDFVANDFDAATELGQDNLNFAGPDHGTATGSVIASPEGSPSGAASWVSGVAPDAELVPIRVANGVAHLSMWRVRKAVEYAMASGCQVVSMSLGGPPSARLRRVLRDARSAGMVCVAAAGNDIPGGVVVWPARYPEVIAAAACNARSEPWSGSSRGARVDTTAPGESVWRAIVEPGDTSGVARGTGTSYASASVAGVAALWISHHGHANLIQRYGASVVDAFRMLAQQTAQAGVDMPATEFGNGIIDAGVLLGAALPAASAVQAAADGGDDSGLGLLGAIFGSLQSSELEDGLLDLFAVDRRSLRRCVGRYGDELGFTLLTQPRLCRRFASHCRQAADLRGRRGSAARRRRSLSGELRRQLLAHGSSPQLASALSGDG